MTEEQYIELTEYKDILYTATQRDYVMFGTLERKRKLSALYAAVFNKKSHMLNGCGACALRECKELGTVYFKEEKIREEKKAEEQTVTEEVKPKKAIRNTKKGKGE